MAKQKTVYVCEECGNESPKWVGQCPECQAWNTLVETMTTKNKSSSTQRSRNFLITTTDIRPQKLAEITLKEQTRQSSNIEEFDRVLGGGFVPGQVVLLAGEPGIGKSTILLQIAENIKGNVLYICGEESPEQIKLRAGRLGIQAPDLILLPETNADSINSYIQTLNNSEGGLALIIIDSIQTLITEDLMGVAGSAGQVRETASRIASVVKQLSIPTILIGHITKEGSIAGPKVLEHLVDTILYLEGDKEHLFRLLKTQKNRFGAVSEVGIFRMGERGMEEVKNPSDLFLEERLKQASGSCVTATVEGYRPLLLEVQALTTTSNFGYPKRTASGFNANRLAVLIAVLEKRAGLKLDNQDVYINVAGGIKLSDHAADLAVCLAIYSSLTNKPLDPKLAAFGEVGLSGEIRKVPNGEKRETEAKKLGFKNIIGPNQIKSIKDAIALLK